MRFVESCRDIWQDTTCSLTLDVRDVRDTENSFGICFAALLKMAQILASFQAYGRVPESYFISGIHS